ncbi:hypothetical protein DPM13_00990 [Paracoccus mutanolyticus]|uniref:Uncharacterized protein n=1 Tax=Paracoccus mutanolyticus TaxID=1499308 RepID=A0ABM6WNZ6_9RHOB|nr:hypothetical protein [Paracoccus mutanolyticus]AWX92329.1 hypothetical protein DPM13_00990 [Paracoccus mutanolyticus]
MTLAQVSEPRHPRCHRSPSGGFEARLEAFENRPVTFAPEDIARAGVFVSIGREGEASAWPPINSVLAGPPPL